MKCRGDFNRPCVDEITKKKIKEEKLWKMHQKH